MLGLPSLRSKKLWLSYLAGAVLLYLFLRRTDWQTMRTGMTLVAWPLFAIAVLLRIASLIASSLRAHALLLPVRDVKLQPIVAATMIGMSANAVVSMQAAEFVRPYILSRSENLDFNSVMSTIVVEWFFDVLAILALFVPALVMTSGVQTRAAFSNLNKGIAVVLLISALGLLALRAVHRHASAIEGFFERHRAPAVSAEIRRFALGLKILHRPAGLAAVSGYSLLVSLLTALSCWFALASFGLSLPLVAAFIVLGLISVGGMIPTPGAVGGFHAICQLGLVTFFKVGAAQAVLPVIGMHAVLYVPPAILGLFYMFSYSRQERQGLT